MKNCGALIHDEVASKEFMEFLKGLVNVSIDVELTWKCKDTLALTSNDKFLQCFFKIGSILKLYFSIELINFCLIFLVADYMYMLSLK